MSIGWAWVGARKFFDNSMIIAPGIPVYKRKPDKLLSPENQHSTKRGRALDRGHPERVFWFGPLLLAISTELGMSERLYLTPFCTLIPLACPFISCALSPISAWPKVEPCNGHWASSVCGRSGNTPAYQGGGCLPRHRSSFCPIQIRLNRTHR